jgi:hypothetical protein
MARPLSFNTFPIHLFSYRANLVVVAGLRSSQRLDWKLFAALQVVVLPHRTPPRDSLTTDHRHMHYETARHPVHGTTKFPQ